MTTIPSLRAGLALPAITALTAVALAVPATASAATSIAVAERGTATSSKASSNTETHRERGLVLECRGKSQGLKAYVQVYENSHYGNDLQVVLGGPDSGVGGGGGTEADLVRKGELTRNARVLVDGKVAKIKGTAVKRGPKSTIHEEYDDAGKHIVVDGTHRQMVTDMSLVYGGKRVPLNCDSAFGFNLDVTTETVA